MTATLAECGGGSRAQASSGCYRNPAARDRHLESRLRQTAETRTARLAGVGAGWLGRLGGPEGPMAARGGTRTAPEDETRRRPGGYAALRGSALRSAAPRTWPWWVRGAVLAHVGGPAS